MLGAMLLLAWSAQRADAQQYKIAAENPEFDSLLSPQIDNQKKFRAKEWLDIEARLMVQMAPEPKSKTADQVIVKWYVAVQNPDKSGTFLLFTRDVTHVNIPLGEEIYVSCYMSPASIRRLLGEARNPEKAVVACSYEVVVNGQPQAYATSSSRFPQGWWEKGGDKLIRSEVVPLLDKSQTPFNVMWWDRYAEVQPKDQGR